VVQILTEQKTPTNMATNTISLLYLKMI